MRIGVAYNAFDSLDLLEHSIDSIRGCVDYICVVYQLVSNFGEDISVQDSSELTRLMKCGKIDDFVLHKPIGKQGHGNEIMKRNLGKDKCKSAGCDYFMTMDVDEFYVSAELSRAVDKFVNGGYDASACKMQTYYKSGRYVISPPEEYYVPLIYKMDDRKFDLRNRWSVPADPTRRLLTRSLLVLDRADIQMHHMSYVRKDIRLKLRNSSARYNFMRNIERISNYFDSWTLGQKAYLAGKEDRYYDVVEVEPLFKI